MTIKMCLSIWERIVQVTPKKHLSIDSTYKCLKISIWDTSVFALERLTMMGIEFPTTNNQRIGKKKNKKKTVSGIG